MEDAGGAVERGHRAVLVRVRRVRVRAALEQLADEAVRREDGVAGVVERRPAARAADGVRVAVPAAPEDESGPRVVGELGSRLEHRLRPLRGARRGRQDERVRTGLGRGHEPRPAGVAVLARDHELRPRQDRLSPVQPRHRLRLAGRAARTSSFACFRSCSRSTTTSLRRARVRGVGRRRDRLCGRAIGRGGLSPARGPDAPSRAPRCYTRSEAGSARAPGPVWRAPSRRGRARSPRPSPP